MRAVTLVDEGNDDSSPIRIIGYLIVRKSEFREKYEK